MKFVIFLVAAWMLVVNGDIFLHNPRGSNNRLDGSGREVINNQRLFDSQNNDRAGYLVGNMYYYDGSDLHIEWTNQHSCNTDHNNCNIVIQYMCGSLVRDGATRSTIKTRPSQCQHNDCQTDTRFGMHEDTIYYARCATRRRNKGLFTADQELKHDDARSTRQNPDGTRSGYECPEERDYYPYWHPTSWRDIAILTSNTDRCQYYKQNSENVKGRGHCVFSNSTMLLYYKKLKIPNNKEDCEKYTFSSRGFTETGQWIESSPHGIPEPDCVEAPWSRDNHNGNGENGQHNTYTWKVPLLKDKCVLRIRYNISTGDSHGKDSKYDFWDLDSSDNINEDEHILNVYNEYGFQNPDDADDRGYRFENNPQVAIFPNIDLRHNLAIDTSQFGRTFQDRSFVFTVRDRRDVNIAPSTAIHNVNVRGKRGNIVQVYPAVEYDFVPNTLHVRYRDYVHFQWTGSNSNPGNNAGQGRAGSDRSNVAVIGPEYYKETTVDPPPFAKGLKIVGDWGRNYPAVISNNTFLGLSVQDRINLATLSNVQYGGDMFQLDDAGTYYDLGPKRVTERGVYHYMSTRNNAFTNRCQKARIFVE